jgi:hypothetical protein
VDAVVEHGAKVVLVPDTGSLRGALWIAVVDAVRVMFERAERCNETRPGVDLTTALQFMIGPLFVRVLYSNWEATARPARPGPPTR